MRLLALGGLMAALLAMLTISSSAIAAASCGDSWNPDGHNGPWYVGSNQSLHGNSLHIGGANCASGTAWNVTYEVVKANPSTGQQFYPIMAVKTGNGPTSFSLSTNPIGCNTGWIYYTQVRNNETGNWIRQPNSGVVIC